MTKRIGLTAMVLVVVMLCALVFAACAPDGDIDSLDSIPELISREESKAEESEEVSVEEGQAHPPVVKDVIHVTEKTVIIAGGCDEGCTVTVTDGSTAVSAASISGYFILEYTIDSTNFSILSLTAQSETLKESPIAALRVEYDSTAMKRIDGYGANVGRDSQVYYDFDLASYTGVINNIDKTTSSTLLTQTELRKFRERVSTYLKNFRKRADNDNVDIIYVLIPNKVTVYPEYLVEGTEQQNYKTRYEQIVESLGMTDVGISNAAILCANLLPGLLIAACSVMAYLMWRMLLRLLLAWQTLPRIPVRLSALTVSPVCAALFLFCTIAALFANSTAATLFGTVCQNLAVIFAPALALVGFTSLAGRNAERSCLSQLLAAGLVVLLFFRPTTALAVAAFVGTFRILAAAILPHNKGGQ